MRWGRLDSNQRPILVATLLLMLALLAAGCGSSDETSPPAEEATTEQTKTAAERSAPPSKGLSEIEKTPAEEAQLKKEYADLGRWKALENAAGATADRLIIPVGPPPKKVVIRDLRIGDGTKLKPKDQFGYEVIGFDYSAGEVGERAWDEEGSWYTYGIGEINKAWEEGFKGMRVGGMREVIAPAALLHDNDSAVYLFRLQRLFRE